MQRGAVKVAVITGRRADYGIYLPVLRAIQADRDLQLDLIVTADHFWPQTGETVKEIIDDGFKINSCWAAYGSMTNVISDINRILAVKWSKQKPGFVLVLGDTGPMLAAATVAAHMNIPVGHIQGGDLTGSIDNKIRYAISAFSDYHFPSLPEHAKRLRRFGIPVDRIRIVGALGIYAMKDAAFIPELGVRTKLGLSDKPIILIIQHPVTDEADNAGEQMTATLNAVKAFPDYEPVIIYPNSDTGSEAMVKVIEASPFKKFKSLPYLMFLSLLKYSRVIVGNSSAGLVEAPLFGVPCVNVGTRQDGRIGNKYNRYDVTYEAGGIRQAVDNIIHDPRCVDNNPYKSDINGPSVIIETIKEALNAR